MKTEIAKVDATPTKRIYRAIIADYDLYTGLTELIDNAIDAWNDHQKPREPLEIRLSLDYVQKTILLADNAGGVRHEDLRKLISPGESSNAGSQQSIGIFGVGSKRAVVALAQMIQVSTRFNRRETFRLEYDDAWLRSTSWELPIYKVEDIAPGSTEVRLTSLRISLDESEEPDLKEHLERVYAHFLNDERLSIVLNGQPIVGKFFDQWSYPPDYLPKQFLKWLTVGVEAKRVRVQFTGGLTIEGGSIGGDYGVFFYCNHRLVARAVRTPEVGFASGIAGVPHPRMSLARIIVEIDGPSDEMPWTSNKTALNFSHHVFRTIQKDVIQLVKTFTGLSKSLQQDFDEKLKPFPTGEILSERLAEEEAITPSYLPKVPPKTINYQEAVIATNKKLAHEKPWTKGLYESVLAFQIIMKQTRFEQRNRIALIILDSTLEIGFKEYLANEVPSPLGDDKLQNLFKDRTQVHAEVEKYLLTGDPIWNQIKYLYRQRCDLIHRRANPSISDETIETFRRVVIKVLYKAFKIRFPQSELSRRPNTRAWIGSA